MYKILRGSLETAITQYVDIIMKVISGLTNVDSQIPARDKFMFNDN